MNLIVILEDNDTFSGLPAWLANPDEGQLEELDSTPICQLERPLAKVEIGEMVALIQNLAAGHETAELVGRARGILRELGVEW